MADIFLPEDEVEFTGEAELKLESTSQITWEDGGKWLGALLGVEESEFPLASKVFSQGDVIYRYNGKEIGRMSEIRVFVFSQGSITVTFNYRSPVSRYGTIRRWVRLTNRGALLHQAEVRGVLRSGCGRTYRNSMTAEYPAHLFERVDGAFFGMQFNGRLC